ncbi:MAG: mechanosensitive ion channel family protein [Cyanobacteria bacterium]|nr:mechanosensitive ion channel family protein [Cyanobacteriota bacterium]
MNKTIIYIILILLIIATLSASLIEHLIINPYTQIAEIIIIIIFGIAIIESISYFLYKYIYYKGIKNEAAEIKDLFKVITYSILIILLLSFYNVNVFGILVSLGFLGIVVGLAAQATLGNLFSGISIIIAKPFQLGDNITLLTWQYAVSPPTFIHSEFLPGYSGRVEEIGFLYTKLIGIDNVPFYIPNGVLNQAMIVNHRRAESKFLNIRLEIDNSISFPITKKIFTKILKELKLNHFKIGLESFESSKYRIIIDVEIKDHIKNEKLIQSKILEKAMSQISNLQKKNKINNK